MKRFLSLLLAALLILSGCGTNKDTQILDAVEQGVPVPAEKSYESRFSSETVIELSDDGIKTDSLSVFASNDIIYYEDRDTYDSGNPYGEGEAGDRHSADEAAAHTVVNITRPGAYRIRGKLSQGQIRVDLGEDADEDKNAVVELILDGADITCTVAPAILFLNVYECDGDRDEDNATPHVDTSKAGANLILEGKNTVNGSYVARIYKDKEGEKKLWKQDGAIYSYMSMNIAGSGALDLTAENEGLGTELHLTIHSGDITIRSGNDGINTNEDDVSVTTINGGKVLILAGLGVEGDGIDSNGYLVIKGGSVVSAAHPASDAGLDSNLGSFIHGGTVVALGSSMDWAESDSGQVTMNLQFASYRSPSDAIRVTGEDGTEIFSFDPAAVLGEHAREYMGVVISAPAFKQGDTYLVYAAGQQMQYTGTDVQRFPGGFGGGRPEGFGGEPPEGFDGKMPEGFGGQPPEGFEGGRPEDFNGQFPEGFEGQPPEGFGGRGEGRGDREPGGNRDQAGAGSATFYMQDKVNFFSGLSAVTE